MIIPRTAARSAHEPRKLAVPSAPFVPRMPRMVFARAVMEGSPALMSTAGEPAPGERWTICRLDHVHWGANGGAGLLLRYRPTDGDPRYLLALRSRSVDEPVTWGIPGGAIRDGESPEAAACREIMEETGRLPAYSVVAEEVQDCGGGWRFHLFLADVHEMVDAYSVRETDATGWFTRAEMSGLPLHSGIQRWLDEPP